MINVVLVAVEEEEDEETGGKTVNCRSCSDAFRKEMSRQKTFLQMTRPLRYMNILTGIGYLDLSEGKHTWWRLAEMVYTVLYSVFVVVFCYYAQTKLMIFQTDMGLHSAMFMTFFYWTVLLSILLMFAARINVEKIREAIDLLETINHRMENMGMSMQRSRHYKLQFQIIAVCSACVSGSVIVSWHMHLKPRLPLYLKLFAACGFNFPALLVLTFDATFFFWINYLRIKFNQLNNLLHVMLTTSIDSSLDKEIPKMTYDFEEATPGQEGVRVINGNANTMKAVKQIHLQLVKIARIINDFYGMQLLLTMSTTFVFLTVLLFCAYRTIFADTFVEYIQNLLVMLFVWILFNFSKLFTVSHVCIKTSTEASDTGELVCQLYEPSTSKEFRAEIRDFSLQMVQNPLVFTACGFFYLDETFVQGVIGTICTYLVILIQVSEVNLPGRVVGNTTVPANAIQMM
ncbi:uncharacterized protein LOC144470441 [Augochlora pura]